MFKDTKHPEVFDFFREISDIPRGSGNEKGIAEHLVSFAEKRGQRRLSFPPKLP